MLDYKWWFLVFSAIALILICIDWWKTKRVSQKDKVFILMTLSLFTFICIILFLFYFVIDYHLPPRYTIFLVILFIPALIFSVQRIVNYIPFERVIF